MRKRVKKTVPKWKGVVLVLLLVLIIGLNVANYIITQQTVEITGRDTTAFALIGLTVNSNVPWIRILEPENITYYFNISDPLILNLTGVSGRSFESWTFEVIGLRHNLTTGETVFGSDSFFPNRTNYLPVFRGMNFLIVNATTSGGIWATDNVTFYVAVENASPILEPLINPIYICENRLLYYEFNATDVDEDILYATENHSALPTPWIIFPPIPRPNFLWELSRFVLFSNGPILKGGPLLNLNDGWKDHAVTIEVSDGARSDYGETVITVIEINNPPIIRPNLTTTTLITNPLWVSGDNSTIYIDINFSDREATNLGWGTLSSNFSLVNISDGTVYNFITMDPNGVINYTAVNGTTPLGTYLATVCVIDDALNPLNGVHPRAVELCHNDLTQRMLTCDSFQLTITDQNRPPTIYEHYPVNLTLTAGSTYPFYFNITDYDPDGTIPDTYWFVDGVQREFDEASNNDSFNYNFGCGVSGFHQVTAFSTDGMLNDSVTWNITLNRVPCPVQQTNGGGGGGGRDPQVCEPIWACDSWSVCQNAKASLDLGLISGESYRYIDEQCTTNFYEEDRCGYQTKNCVDFKCNETAVREQILRFCLYTENPTCYDGIQNCHDGLCELLVDCGGPCDACPSCSDGIKNQGEDGVDCGGPCPWQCEPEVPLLERSNTIYIFLGILLIIIILIIIKLFRVLKYKKAIGESKKPNL